MGGGRPFVCGSFCVFQAIFACLLGREGNRAHLDWAFIKTLPWCITGLETGIVEFIADFTG